MNRRNFLQLSVTASAAVLFSRVTHAYGAATLVNHPDEVWAETGGQWFQLKRSGKLLYHYKDVEVGLQTNGNAQGVYVQSPKTSLTGIRLKWKHNANAQTSVLGDHWERTYGDLAWKAIDANAKKPWYVLLHDDSETACFGVKTNCNAICYWNVSADAIELTLDTHSGGVGVELGARKLHAADIITTKSFAGENAFATDHRFCKMMCTKPRLPKQPVYGINDWYFAYGKNSQPLIKEITGIMAELAPDTTNRPFSVVDGGWMSYSPYLPGDASGWGEDFTKPNNKFSDMHTMANEIKALGMRPGIWTRVLCGRHDENPSLVLRPKADNKFPILDPTIAENIEHVRHVISTYKTWGYDMVKHDYSTADITGRWGFQMTDKITDDGWAFHDRTKTTAEVINHLYRTIREAAGDMYIIGCNTMSHLSAGLFELNRIGDDTSGQEWGRTLKMGVNTLGFRLPQHNAFYAVDGDCVGVTKAVSWDKNKQWMQLLAESSAPLFISGQPDALGAEQKQAIKESFAKAAKPQPLAEPLDWLTNPLPAKWKLNGKEVDFEW